MKKIFSIIISFMLFVSFLPVYAVNAVNSISLPTSDCELGFVFTTDGVNHDSTPDEYSGVVVISEELNIYYASDLNALKTVASKFNIIYWEEDFKIEIPKDESSLEDEFTNDFISLFSVEDNIDNTQEETQIATETQYPNDPLLERQWHYDAVKAYVFRDNAIDGKGIRVGIIDSGLTKEFKTFHDFEGVDIQTGVNVAAYIEQTRPGHENEDRLDCTEDNQTHGTGVASIICAKTDNNIGIAGLSDGCTVIPYKIEDAYYGTDNDWLCGAALMRAIELAYQDGCQVLNISWGGNETSAGNSLNRIIDNCIKNGMIIVAATGNSGKTTNDVEYPAACDNVIGVGSVEPNCGREDAVIDATTEVIKSESEYTENDTFFTGWLRSTVQRLNDNEYTKTDSSTANESVFVCAPGSGMTLACPSTRIKQNFNISSGTSFATPIVASAAIGVKQMRPYVDTDMFKEILMATAVDLEDEGYDMNTGYGMVNFERIYNYVSQMPLTAPERTPDVSIDFENEQLIGFPINRSYTVNGEDVVVSEDGTLPIADKWFGTTVSIVKKASSESYEDSIPQELVIPARPPAPVVELLSDNTVNIGSGIIYKEETADTWQTGTAGDTIVLEPGKTYSFKVQYTNDSFASEVKEITVKFVPEEQYDIETDIMYTPDTGECIYSAIVKTAWDINATGIIAVYGSDGSLKCLETVDKFPKEGINKKLDFALSVGDTVKFLVWNSFQSMQPRDRVKLSEYSVVAGGAE